MKRFWPVFLSLFLLVSLLPLPAAASGIEVNAASAVLMEKETGTALYETNAHERLAPASVTKVMTILLVMDALESGRVTLDTPVTASAYASGMGGSQVFLEEGEQLTVHEMLKCVAVSSANDAAVALAEHLAGSEAAFVEQMNARAKALGMADTTFVNCTGLPADGHLTSAWDVALMSRELIARHPDVREYTTIWMDSIRDGAFGLSNTNRLIRFYPDATGLKTGFTDTALYCLSATAERGGMELIAAVMKAPTSEDRFQTAKRLLDYGFARYALVDVPPDGPLPPVDVLLGTQGQVQPELSRACRLLLPRDSIGQIATEITLSENVAAPVEAGQKLGEMTVRVDGEVKDAIPIVAAEAISRLSVGSVFSRLLRALCMTC